MTPGRTAAQAAFIAVTACVALVFRVRYSPSSLRIRRAPMVAPVKPLRFRVGDQGGVVGAHALVEHQRGK